MAQKQPPSLGDLKPTYVKVQEVHDLPTSRPDIISKFASILNGNGVQRVVIEIGQPIRVDRFILASDSPEEVQVPEEDILYSIRNHEILEYGTGSKNPYEDLFKLFKLVSSKNLRPTVFLVHKVDELDSWLGLEKMTHLQELFGVEILQSAGVEDNVLLLVASEGPDIMLTVKMYMEVAREANRGKGT